MTAGAGRGPARTPAEARAERIARALLVALAAAFVITLAAGSGSSTASGRVGGDYPAFYGAGTIVADGHGHDLYDADVQGRSQHDLFGSDSGYLAYVYPPPVALAFAPLAKLPYRLSYALATALLAAALALALHLLRPVVPTVDRLPLVSFTAALCFYPMFRAVTAGQNTSITLLLVVGLWRAERDDRGALGALCLGLLLLKPQLGLLFVALWLLRRRWLPVLGAAAVAAALWCVGAVVSGPGWVTDWWHLVRAYENGDARLNAQNAVSWLGSVGSVLGVGSTAATVVGGVLALATLAIVARTWLRDDDPGRRYAVAAAGVLLISPHTVFYDAGLLVLTGFVLWDGGDDRTRRVVPALWALSLLHVAANALTVTPVVAVTVAAFALAAFAPLAPRTPRLTGADGRQPTPP